MQTVQISAYGGPEVLELVEAPPPEPGPDQARIRVAAVAVNPADPKWRQGMFQSFLPVTMPHTLVYDIAGVVDLVGADVTGVKLGDRVAALLDILNHGGYAEYVVAPAA